jgi:hypothetical protein
MVLAIIVVTICRLIRVAGSRISSRIQPWGGAMSHETILQRRAADLSSHCLNIALTTEEWCNRKASFMNADHNSADKLKVLINCFLTHTHTENVKRNSVTTFCIIKQREHLELVTRSILSTILFWGVLSPGIKFSVILWNSEDVSEFCLLPALSLFYFSAYSSALKMEATCSSETLVDLRKTARFYLCNSVDRTPHSRRCKTFK